MLPPIDPAALGGGLPPPAPAAPPSFNPNDLVAPKAKSKPKAKAKAKPAKKGY
jgi:hypothetical protein